jgi:magnesium transporter
MRNISGKVLKKIIRQKKEKVGLPPGTLVHTGERKVEKVGISVFDYDEHDVSHSEFEDIEDAISSPSRQVKWININGLHDLKLIERIGKHYKIHPLVLEDIVHTSQRPKMEDFDGNIYVVLKMFTIDDKTSEITWEQISLILGDGYVLSFQEQNGDVFDYVRERILTSKGRIRKMNGDYLLYALVDSIIDNYFVILEAISDNIEILHQQATTEPNEKLLQNIHETKRQMLLIKKAVWPLRELISGLQKCESPLIDDSIQPFLRDVYDHIVQIIDTTETLREMTSGILEIYLSTVSNRMNSVMQVLTVIATIFIPLTFVAGIYGMNFENMPELSWKLSYPWGFWTVITLLILIMLSYFKKKNWF